MRPTTILLSLLLGFLASSSVRAALILNEALANEPGSTMTLEWVEVLNWSDSGQVTSLSGYEYLDGGQLVTITNDIPIPAGGFVVLARKATGTGSFEERWGNASGIWGDHASESYPVIGLFQLSLRNSSDTLRLISPDGDTSTIFWRFDSGDGVSIERIRPGRDDDASNFGASRDQSGSTPGRENSVLPPRGDLAIDTVVVGPVSPSASDTIHFAVHIRNVGFGDAMSGAVIFGRDSVEPIVEQSFGLISEGGEMTVVIDWFTPRPGISYLSFVLSDDPDTSNNTYEVPITVRFERSHVVISEYLANPDPGGPDEWVEIVNLAPYPVNLEGCRLGDSLNAEILPTPSIEMPVNAFWILAENILAFRAFYPAFAGTVLEIPGWRALNNTGDGIRLIGPSGEIIDSLSFRTVYSGNRSVERVELLPSIAPPRDWAGSKDPSGATPGRLNSVVRGIPGAILLDSVWIVAGAPDILMIYTSTTNTGFGPSFARDLYIGLSLDPAAPEIVNDTIGIVAIPVMVEAQTLIIPYEWQSLPPGIHRVVVWTTNDDGSPMDPPGVAFTTVPFQAPLLIVSEYMAAPNPSGPGEWIEVYNASGIVLSLRGVRIGDSSGVSSLPPPLTTLEPEAFLVVAQDEDQFRAFYPVFDGDVRELPTWRTLSDDGDGIRLLGPENEIIDSVTFGERNEGSISIERRQLVAELADPRDWGASEDPSGATPGRANSIIRLSHDLSLDSIRIDNHSPSLAEPVTVRAWITNAGFAPSGGGILLLWSPPSIEDLNINLPEIAPGQSLLRETMMTPPSPGYRLLDASLSQDENSVNNRKLTSLSVRFIDPSIIITEFLVNPEAGGPGEWVEAQNVSDFTISLTSCEIGDADGATGWLGVPGGLSVAPGDFVIFSENRTAFTAYYPNFDGLMLAMGGWRQFNNEGDMIRLIGPSGEIIDSFTYSTVYDNNRSNERSTSTPTFSHPSDWTMSVDPSGATPGRPNSVSAASAGAFQINVTPNPVFRSAGQKARIDYRLEIGESLTLKVFDRAGRIVRTIAENQPSATGYIEWDGADDDGADLRPGPYILSARSEPSGSMEKKVIVIAP